MTEEFSWEAVAEHIVQQQVECVAIYANDRGDIVIRQQQRWDEEDDSWIVIAKANAFAAARAILEAADIRPDVAAMIASRPDIDWAAVDQEFECQVLEADDSKPKDRTAAQRQRRYRARKRDGERDSTVTESVTDRDELPLVAAE